MGDQDTGSAPAARPRVVWVWVFSCLLVVVGGLLGVLVDGTGTAGDATIPFVVLLAAFVCAEMILVRIYVDAHSHAFSLSEAVLVVALLHSRPTVMGIAQALTMVTVLGIIRHLPLVKIVFNVGNTAVASMSAAGVFRLIGDGEVTHVRTWVAAVAAVSVYAALGALCVSVVIALAMASAS